MRLGLAVLFLLPALQAVADPKTDFMLHCQGCHLADGSGSPGSVPSLVDSVARFLRLTDGRAFLVRVPGVALSTLDDRRLAAVLDWMVGEFGPAADAALAPSFTAEEVARLRARPLTDVASVRRELLERLEADGSEP